METYTIYQPTAQYPYGDAIDMTKDCTFSCMVNGEQVDSYLLIVKDENNNIVYTSNDDISIGNNDIGITYSGTWTNNQNSFIDDYNIDIQYYGTGWLSCSQQQDMAYYKGTYHYSSTNGDYIQYNFVGTGINCYFTEGKNKGICQIYIDNELMSTLDTYIPNGTENNGNNSKVLGYSNQNLTYGSHTIKILVTGTKNSLSTSCNIEFDYFEILNTNGSKNSNNINNYIQYSFQNSGINVYMDKTPDSGIVEIFIDGTSMGQVDLYSGTYDLDSLVYINMTLSSTNSHTIKIINTGNKNSQSINGFCYFKGFELINKTVLENILYDKDTLSIPISANTITYKGFLKWVLQYWNGNESRKTGEAPFFNMTTPIISLNVPSTVTSEVTEVNGTYTQAEKVPISKWNMELYTINYEIYCGNFGENVTGETIYCGHFGDTINGKHINCGHF